MLCAELWARLLGFAGGGDGISNGFLFSLASVQGSARPAVAQQSSALPEPPVVSQLFPSSWAASQ